MYHSPKSFFRCFSIFRVIVSRTSFMVLLVLGLILTGSLPLMAEELSGQASDMGEIVVTASRYEEQRILVPSNVTVITSEDISKSTARTIPDLLRKEAGLFVTDLTGSGRNVIVDLRGFGETGPLNTLVLVDGRRVNQPDLSGTDWTQIPLERVERIEVIRGARASILYGDNASGGVVNIITKEGEGQEYDLMLGAGSYASSRASASASGNLKNLSYYLTGTYYRTDGYRDNSNVEAKDLGLDLRYYISEKAKIGLSAGYHKDDAGLPGALTEADLAGGLSRKATTNPYDFSEVEDYYLKADGEVNLWGESFFKADASYRKRRFLSYASFSGGNFLGDSEIDTFTFSPSVLIVNETGNLRNELTAGLDFYHAEEDIENTSVFFGTPSKGIFTLEKETWGYYIYDVLGISNRLSLSGGYRHDSADYSFSPSTPDGTDFDEDLYTIGASYNIANSTVLYLSYSKGFRYPVLDEIYSFFTNTIDAGLIPQESDDYEIGVRTDLGYLRAEANLFRIDTDDEILYNPVSFKNENLDGETRREGLEVSFYIRPVKLLTIDGTYTYTKAEIQSGSFDGNEIPGVPKHKLTGHVTLSPVRNLLMALEIIYKGERPYISDFSNDFGKLAGYTVLNLKTRYTWGKVTAFLNLNNLTDEEYEEYGVIQFPGERAVYPSPGLNVFGGVSLSF